LKRTEDHRIERPVVLGDFFGGSRWFEVILDDSRLFSMILDDLDDLDDSR